ncbi:MAG: hypothetical protein WC254_06305 [Candidatus Woesearchaeota archaeon]|jgi:hypothetical protein
MKHIFLIILLFILIFPISCSEDNPEDFCGDGICDAIEKQKGLCPEDCSTEMLVYEEQSSALAGTSFITYVPSEGIGNIAVKVTLPKSSRYLEGAPVLVYVSTFFTPQEPVFDTSFIEITEQGFIHVTYLWPGKSDHGVSSEGIFDYGGEDSLQALRDVIKFVSGDIPNYHGKYLSELCDIIPLSNNVGLYAFSHPGIAATNVLALYSDELNVAYFVGRENPTTSSVSAMDFGYWNDDIAVYNPFYVYPEDYSPTTLAVDYSSVGWDDEQHIPYFDVNNNNVVEEGVDFIHGPNTPTLYGKTVYSKELTQALLDNGALTEETWPENVATPQEAAELWDFRETVDNYQEISSDLHVILIFNEYDHVQTVIDKPHIHQAYDGFTSAGVWTRLNPDSSYVQVFDPSSVTPDNNANTEPSDWTTIKNWAYINKQQLNMIVPYAAILELADRTYTNTWDNNINNTLIRVETSILR